MTNDHVRIVRAEASKHRQAILDLLAEHFVKREPIEHALSADWSDAGPFFISLVDDLLKQSNSFVAVDTRTNQVIGCRLSKLEDVDRSAPEEDYTAVYINYPSPKMQIFKIITDRLMKGWKEDFIECRKLFKFEAVCVHSDYAGAGVAKRMMDESINLARRLGADHIMAVATNIKSQIVLEQCGFYTRKLLNYDDVVDEYGKPLVRILDGSTKSINWMVKKLDPVSRL